MGQSAMWSMTTVRSGSFSSSTPTSGMRVMGARTVIGTLSSWHRFHNGRHERTAKPIAARVARRTQTNTAKALCGQAREMIGRLGIQRIDAADAVKDAGKTLQHAGQKTVVVLVVDHLDDHRTRNAVGFHQVQQRLRRGVAFGHARPFGKRKRGVVLPHVNVGIDDSRIGGHCVRRHAGQQCTARDFRPLLQTACYQT